MTVSPFFRVTYQDNRFFIWQKKRTITTFSAWGKTHRKTRSRRLIKSSSSSITPICTRTTPRRRKSSKRSTRRTRCFRISRNAPLTITSRNTPVWAAGSADSAAVGADSADSAIFSTRFFRGSAGAATFSAIRGARISKRALPFRLWTPQRGVCAKWRTSATSLALRARERARRTARRIKPVRNAAEKGRCVSRRIPCSAGRCASAYVPTAAAAGSRSRKNAPIAAAEDISVGKIK